MHFFDYNTLFKIPYLGIFFFDLAVHVEWHLRATFQETAVALSEAYTVHQWLRNLHVHMFATPTNYL